MFYIVANSQRWTHYSRLFHLYSALSSISKTCGEHPGSLANSLGESLFRHTWTHHSSTSRFMQNSHYGFQEQVYIDSRGQISPWPASLVVQVRHYWYVQSDLWYGFPSIYRMSKFQRDHCVLGHCALLSSWCAFHYLQYCKRKYNI
jgi:hypothetical protein